MKTYGLILADNGSNWYFQGTADRRWTDTMVDQLKMIPATCLSGDRRALPDDRAQLRRSAAARNRHLPTRLRQPLGLSPRIGETARMTTSLNGRTRVPGRDWANEAVRRLETDTNRSADTHLHALPAAVECRVSTSTSRTSRRIRRDRSSIGWRARCSCTGCATAGSARARRSSRPRPARPRCREAYFARMLGLPFIAVMPRIDQPREDRADRARGRDAVTSSTTRRRCIAEAQRLAAERDGHYLDQFTYAERATDWRGNNNIAESIFAQMSLERHPVPTGSWSAPAPAAPARRSAATPRYRRLPDQALRRRPGEFGVLSELARRRPLDVQRRGRRGSRASAARGSSRRSCPTSSTA